VRTPGHFARAGQAGFGARSAARAARLVPGQFVLHAGNCLRVTHSDARIAGDAQVGAQHRFGGGRLRFGVVAPPAVQRAAFEKNSRANTRSVVDRIFANIEDRTGKNCHATTRQEKLILPESYGSGTIAPDPQHGIHKAA
jgi:hypothetical protein